VLSSSFDRGEVLQLILRELHSVIPYDTASVMLIEGRMLRSAALRDQRETATPEHMTFRLDQWSGVELVVERREPVVIADTSQSPYWTHSAATEYIRSWLGVPLIAKGRLLGVLNINSRKPDRFTQRDAEVALAFANQAAVAMENARLYQESVTRVEQELEIARQIQSNLFPSTLPQAAGLTLAATCLPARETGGDFYDVVALGGLEQHSREGAVLGIMVGDVSGKSIPAAMLMAVARSIARSEARDHQKPEAVMRETNSLVALDVPPRTFVALCYATLDMERRRLALANAGQLAPLRRRPDGRVEYLEVNGPTFPLGIAPDVPYVALDVDLAPGDVLVFYTDGIVEAQNSDRELFGFERLEALVRAEGHLPPQQLIERVLAAIEDFIGPVPQHDDMTLVVLQVE
jgi:sigma-B regulation protein RsbU (phosphoserine phosphatase)